MFFELLSDSFPPREPLGVGDSQLPGKDARMRYGHFIMGTRGGSYHAMVDQVVEAEALGFDTAWLAERHQAQ